MGLPQIAHTSSAWCSTAFFAALELNPLQVKGLDAVISLKRPRPHPLMPLHRDFQDGRPVVDDPAGQVVRVRAAA